MWSVLAYQRERSAYASAPALPLPSFDRFRPRKISSRTDTDAPATLASSEKLPSKLGQVNLSELLPAAALLAMCDRDVLYSCGACGYHLNLSSSQRLLPEVSVKALRKSRISFLSIDESRINQLDEFVCSPYAHANGSMGFHKLRTKLLCGSCGQVIGHTHSNGEASSDLTDTSDSSTGSETSSPGSGISEYRRYCIKIKALLPVLDP